MERRDMPGEPLAVAEFELTPEEWVSAASAYLWDTDIHQAARFRQRRVFGLAGGMLAVLFLLMGSPASALIAGLTFGCVAWASPSLYRRALLRGLKSSAGSGIVEGLFGPHRIELWPDCLRDITAGYETRWRWSSIRGVGESEGTFIIQTGPLALLPLPSSAFPDAASLRRFGDAFYGQLSAARPEGGEAQLP